MVVVLVVHNLFREARVFNEHQLEYGGCGEDQFCLLSVWIPNFWLASTIRGR